MNRLICLVVSAFALVVQCGAARSGPLAQPQSPAAPQLPRSDMSAGATDPATQLQGEWVLTSVAGTPVPDAARATMNVDAGRFSFNLGCNTINALPEFGPGYVYFSDGSTTSMACPPEVATREAQLVEVLASIEAMQVGAGDAVAFYDATNGLANGARRSKQ